MTTIFAIAVSGAVVVLAPVLSLLYLRHRVDAQRADLHREHADEWTWWCRICQAEGTVARSHIEAERDLREHCAKHTEATS